MHPKRRELVLMMLGGAIFSIALLSASLATEAGPRAVCPGYSQCPAINYAQTMSEDADAIALSAKIAEEEQKALARAQRKNLPSGERNKQLGRLLFFDVNLSVNRNQACATCHAPGMGFSGGVSLINRSVVSFPGSVFPRTGNRRPLSASYAAFAPILHYVPETNEFVGGTFWDAHATGEVTGSPAADQAMFPFVNPLEMAMPDRACVLYRVANGPYTKVFTAVWGIDLQSIRWPANSEKVCQKPGQGGSLTPLKLATPDRLLANTAYQKLAQSIASFEVSSAVSPFTSKFDAVLAGTATFTAQEARGRQIFNSEAVGCSECHVSVGSRPLFTDFSATNIGIPANRNNPYLHEDVDNGKGLVANPLGTAFVDNGIGPTLQASTNGSWRDLAPQFMGAIQVPTLRNVARVSRKGMVRAFMHNGFFTDLKQVVHFYNTRDVLPQCHDNGGVVGVDCWPAPEQPANLNTEELGNLGLSDQDESDIVAFLKTLSDGYKQ